MQNIIEGREFLQFLYEDEEKSKSVGDKRVEDGRSLELQIPRAEVLLGAP